MNNKIFLFIVGIPFILFIVIGGYFFWDIGRPIQSSQKININTKDIPPPENITNGGPIPAPPWVDPATKPVPNTTEQQPISQPIPQNQPTVSAQKLTIHTQTGDVFVKDFYKNPGTQLLDKKRDAGLKDDPNYVIVYYVNGQSFNIALSGENLQTARDAAEKTFLQILGVSKTDACKLDVSMGVPATVSKTASGVEYHLSFCPNGVPLP